MPYMQSPSGEVFHTNNPGYHTDCENLGNGENGKRARMEYARRQLRAFIPVGTTVYYDVKRVSSSGMSRAISFYVPVIRADGSPYIRGIDGLMSDACGMRQTDSGIVFSGCGMNMGFHGVYCLGRALSPDGFGKIGEHPDSKKKIRARNPRHAKILRARGYVFRGRNGCLSGWDIDGGYALEYSSL